MFGILGFRAQELSAKRPCLLSQVSPKAEFGLRQLYELRGALAQAGPTLCDIVLDSYTGTSYQNLLEAWAAYRKELAESKRAYSVLKPILFTIPKRGQY